VRVGVQPLLDPGALLLPGPRPRRVDPFAVHDVLLVARLRFLRRWALVIHPLLEESGAAHLALVALVTEADEVLRAEVNGHGWHGTGVGGSYLNRHVLRYASDSRGPGASRAPSLSPPAGNGEHFAGKFQ